MNLALISLIIILFLLPGFLFRAFLISSDSLENPLDTSIKTEIGLVFLFSIVINLIGYLLINAIGLYSLDFTQLFLVLIGNVDLIQLNLIGPSIPLFLCYILIASFLASLSAYFLKRLILNHFWDIKCDFIPISNEWDKLLSGRQFLCSQVESINESKKLVRSFYRIRRKELKKKKNTKNEAKETLEILKLAIKEKIAEYKRQKKYCYDFLGVELDILVGTTEGDMIYKGLLYKYYLDKNNKLEKIILKDTFRRRFIDVRDATNQHIEFQEFSSKLFVIESKEIKNINVRFAFIEPDDEVEAEEPPPIPM